MSHNDSPHPITKIRDRIEKAAQKHRRSAADIALLAVSKTRPAERLREAHADGQRACGENYLQEALTEIQALRHLPLTWHFIGAMQSNKTRAIAEHFDSTLKVSLQGNFSHVELT